MVPQNVVITIERTVAVLLCAGLSRRFGAANKLMAPLRGEPLVLHAARVLRSRSFLATTAVISGGEDGASIGTLLRQAGFELINNPSPEAGKDHSIRLGLADALVRKAEAAVLCFGDMPNITSGHIAALLLAANDATAAFSEADDWRSPPVLIPARLASAIVAATDRPVRALLTDSVGMSVESVLLADFDTVEDFEHDAAAMRRGQDMRSRPLDTAIGVFPDVAGDDI